MNGYSTGRSFIGFVGALLIITGALALVTSTIAQRPTSLGTGYSQRFDVCPYYPSPVSCRVDSAAAATASPGG